MVPHREPEFESHQYFQSTDQEDAKGRYRSLSTCTTALDPGFPRIQHAGRVYILIEIDLGSAIEGGRCCSFIIGERLHPVTGENSNVRLVLEKMHRRIIGAPLTNKNLTYFKASAESHKGRDKEKPTI